MALIHITDGQSDRILDVIGADDVISNEHEKSLKNSFETFNFNTFTDKRYSQHLTKKNRVIIEDEDPGRYIEFVIFEAIKNSLGGQIEVFTTASYLELQYAKIIRPHKTEALSAESHAREAIIGTEWQVGEIDYKGVRTINYDDYTNPYVVLRKISNTFDLELNFRVKVRGGRVIGRYVDLIERIGTWSGREVEFGNDLINIKRTEKTDKLVTALLGIGPEQYDDENGEGSGEDNTHRLEVYVEDQDALERWGRGGTHIVDIYEPETTDQNMSIERLESLTRAELKKRINTLVEYECEVVDLEHVPGMENKQIRFGDTLKIKDTKFNPPLYLEARVHSQKRDIKVKGNKEIVLGDFIEYTENEVRAAWLRLQKEIRKRVSFHDLREYTFDKFEIIRRDETVFEDGKTFAELIGKDAKDHAEFVAFDAERNAKEFAEEKASDTLEHAKAYAVAKEIYEEQMQIISNDISERAPIEYVDGQLRIVEDELDNFNIEIEKKADKSIVYTIEEVDNRLLNKVSVTQYTADMDDVVSSLESYGTRIGQNEEAIGLKADRTELNTVESTLKDQIANVQVQADEIGFWVTEIEAEVDGIEIGGRNYVSSHIKNWTRTSGAKVEVKNDGSFYITNPSNGTWGRVYSPNITVNPGEWVTASVDVIKTSKRSSLNIRDNTESSKTVKSANTSSKDGERVSISWQNTSNKERTVSMWLNVYGNWSENDGTQVLHVNKIKLEKGNRATDWTPAPEDIDATIDDLDGRVSAAHGEIEVLAGEVALRASKSELDSVEGRLSEAESEINVMAGQIELKADSKIVDDQGEKITSVEIVLDALEEEIRLKADKVEIEGFLTAEDLRVDGDIEFGGKLRGASGSFEGSIMHVDQSDSGNLRPKAVQIEDGELRLGTVRRVGDKYVFNESMKIHEHVIKSKGINTMGSDDYLWIGTDPVPFYGSGIQFIKADTSDGQRYEMEIFLNGRARHVFMDDGTKIGGSIEIDDEILGMSPIDSPQILLSTLIPDVILEAGKEHEIMLEERFAKAIESLAVFPSREVVIRKAGDRFYVKSSEDMTVDFMVYGHRVTYGGTYWQVMN